jgi:hypothetical protein
VREHVESCATCRESADSWRKLGEAIGAPIPPEPGAAARLEARLLAAPASAPRSRWSRVWVTTGALVAAAAAVAFVVRSRVHDEGTFTPRGGPVVHSLERDVGVSVAREGSAFAVSYTNLGAPAFALVFAVDARNETHWIAPAWIDETTDPESIELTTSQRQITLTRATAFDDLAPGALHVIVAVTPRPHHVSEIEHLPAPITTAAIRGAWQDASVREIVVEEHSP